MPRSPTLYSLPPGTTPQQPNTVIQSATWNAAMDDIAQTFNTVLPKELGGTGAATSEGARTALGAIGRIKKTNFIVSGTFTPDSNMIFCEIMVQGGGGGGGGATGGTNTASAGGGGGGGAFARNIFTKAEVGASRPVSIGAAGSGGVAGPNNGSSGGTTAVTGLISADGGFGGLGNGSLGGILDGTPGGGAGVVTSGGLTIRTGSGGGSAVTRSASGGLPFVWIHSGGASYFSGGSSTYAGTGKVGDTTVGYGGGGQGAAATTVNNAGGNGSPGFVSIIEYCTE